MGADFQFIQWNQQKKKYDLIVLLLVVTIMTVSIGISLYYFPEITQETLIIRTTAITAFVLLHIILSIGPLSRINSSFLVLLYNRRHLGVLMFLIAAIHGIFSLIQFHALGNVNVLESLFTSNVHYGSFYFFPFQVLGYFSLLILAMMALSSHDFWLKILTPKWWKTLHRFVYVAYVALLFHVFLGTLQGETSVLMPSFLVLGAIWIMGIHILAHLRNRKTKGHSKAGFVGNDLINKIKPDRAMTIRVHDQTIALYRWNEKLFAVSNSCKHQGGPVAEGKIVDGCITCPWHGYQYYPHNGKSPPPFDEKLANYQIQEVEDGVIIDPSPMYAE